MADLGLSIESAQPRTSHGEDVAKGQPITLRRNEFLIEENPGNELDKKTLKDKGEPIKSEYLQLSEGIIEGLRTNVNQYIDDLAFLVEGNRTLLDTPGHEYDKAAWQLLGNSDRNIRNAKIADFLGSTEGIKFADSLLLQQASRKLQAVGVYASTSEPGKRDDVVSPQTIRTGDGQGAINKVWHDTLRPKLAELGPKAEIITGTLVGSTMAGLDIGSRTDGLRGFIVGGGVGFATGVLGLFGGNETTKLFRAGETFDLKRSVDALAALQTNPQEVEYLKRMYNIDITKFDVDIANQKLEVSPNADKQDVNRLRDEGLQALQLHRDLYKDLGVPPEKLDIMPELNLFEDLGGFEQSTSRVSQEVIDAFYEGGYDPDTHTLADNQERMFKARSEVMTSLVSEYIRNEKDIENKSRKRPVTALQNKLHEYEGDSPAVMNRRMKQENEKKQRLIEEQSEKEKLLDRFKVSDEALELLRKTAEELRKPPYNLSSLPGNPSSIEVNTLVNAEIGKLTSSLRDSSTTPPSGLKEDLELAQRNYNTELAAERKRLTTDLRAGLGPKDTLSDETKRNIEKEAADHARFLHGTEIERLNQEIANIEKKITDLNSLEQVYRDSSTEFNEKQRVVLVDAPKELVAIKRAYETLRPAVGATITDALLEKETVDQLIVRAVAPPYSLPDGTSEEHTELRKMIIQAKSELKARREEIVNPSSSMEIQAISDIALNPGLPITIDDLLNTKSDTELIHILTTDAAYAGLRVRTTDLRRELELAKTEAAKRLRNRYRSSLEEEIKDDGEQLKEITEKSKTLSPVLKAERERLEVTLDLIARQESLFIASEKITHDEQILNKFTNLSRYSVADRAVISENEQKFVDSKRVPKGYFEFMDLFFDYRSRTDKNRSEYFEQITKVLPPEKLARLLNQNLNLGARNALSDVLTALNTQIDRGTLDRIHLRGAFIAIADRLQEEALALS